MFSIQLSFVDPKRLESRVLPLCFQAYLFGQHCYLKGTQEYFQLQKGDFDQVRRDKDSSRITVLTCISDFVLRSAKVNNHLLSPVSEA